jgi:tetratricopeptide (TPR) repeat protein
MRDGAWATALAARWRRFFAPIRATTRRAIFCWLQKKCFPNCGLLAAAKPVAEKLVRVTSGAKAPAEQKGFIAALKRCAAKNQVQSRQNQGQGKVFPQPVKAFAVVLFVGVGTIAAYGGQAPWVEVRSPDFSVITDSGEKDGREVALHFEQMRSVFGSLMTRAKVNLPVPLEIVAFRNAKEMREVAPLYNGKPTELAGLFQGADDRSFIILDMSVGNPWRVVFHEYGHRLLEGNIAFHMDPWFEEGFAEYFSSIEVDNREARVGKIPEETYQILNETGMMKVAELFRVQQNSRIYNESGDHRNQFYAESALVVHYLYDNQMIPKLPAYFSAVEEGKKTVEEAIEAAFGMTAAQLDRALEEYRRSARCRYYEIPTPAEIVPAGFKVVGLRATDAQAVIADIHAHSYDYLKQAVGEFQQILETDPDNEAALRGAGFACLRQHDYKRAAEYLRQAVARDSKDARVHYYYAMLLSEQGRPDESGAAAIKRELETAIALDPEMADAYSLLGFTEAFSGEPKKGIADLKKAVEMSPRNDHYRFNLAAAWLANGEIDEAIASLRKLTESGDEEVAARARESLTQANRLAEEMKAARERHARRVEKNGGASSGDAAPIPSATQ